MTSEHSGLEYLPDTHEAFAHLPRRHPRWNEARRIMAGLVEHRRNEGIRQHEIARHLQRDVSRIAEMEAIIKPNAVYGYSQQDYNSRVRQRVVSVPSFLRLERYARALGGTLVETPESEGGGWNYRPPANYRPPDYQPQHHIAPHNTP